MREQDGEERDAEWYAEQQVVRIMQGPAYGEQIVVETEGWQVVEEVVLQARAHHERGEDGGEKEQDVHPVAAARGRDDEDLVEVRVVTGREIRIGGGH